MLKDVLEKSRPTAESLLSLLFQYAALSEIAGNPDVRNVGEEQLKEIWFRENPEELHDFFRELQRQYAATFPELNRLTFSTQGAFPYSPELTEIIGNLQLDGIIGRRNPGFDRFGPNLYGDSGEVVTDEIHRVLHDEEREAAFREMAEEVKTLIGD